MAIFRSVKICSTKHQINHAIDVLVWGGEEEDIKLTMENYQLFIGDDLRILVLSIKFVCLCCSVGCLVCILWKFRRSSRNWSMRFRKPYNTMYTQRWNVHRTSRGIIVFKASPELLEHHPTIKMEFRFRLFNFILFHFSVFFHFFFFYFSLTLFICWSMRVLFVLSISISFFVVVFFMCGSYHRSTLVNNWLSSLRFSRSDTVYSICQ